MRMHSPFCGIRKVLDVQWYAGKNTFTFLIMHQRSRCTFWVQGALTFWHCYHIMYEKVILTFVPAKQSLALQSWHDRKSARKQEGGRFCGKGQKA